MAEKVTTMVIKVDLQCDRCYKKIRKVLCGFPEIRDQVYDKKQNAVKITVVSCCPDRIKKKIWSKGGESVEKIEIEKIEVVSGDKKKEPEKKKEGGGDKAKDSAAGGEKKKDEPEKKGGKEGEPKKKDGGKEGEKGPAKEPEKKDGGDKPKDKEPEMKPKPKQPMPLPVAGYPSIFPPVYPVQAYYDPYQQHQVAVGGPRTCHCQQCHGNMPGYYGARDANRGGYNGCQYDYFSEENPSGCTVM